MKKIAIIIASLFVLNVSFAQTLTKVFTVKVNPDMTGNNGGSVAWHPLHKKYYFSFAGNESYGLIITDVKGKILSDSTLACGIDARGIWYNNITKTIEGNGYDAIGMFKYKLDKKGMIKTVPEVFNEEIIQPDKQSIAVYDSINKQHYYLNNGMISVLKKGADVVEDYIELDLTDYFDDSEEFGYTFNSYSFAYTNKKGKEFVLINHMDSKLVFFDKLTGKQTDEVLIPKSVKLFDIFNFGYANGLFFFYNKDDRYWEAYKLGVPVKTK